MAIKFTVKRTRKGRNHVKITKAMHKRAISMWDKAIGAFLLGVAFEVSRHQDTGMSYASLFALARKVRALGKMPPLSPNTSFRKGYGYPLDPNGKRSAEAGMQFGSKSLRPPVYGSPRRFVMKFEFEIVVYQYLLHEYKGISPWNSLEKGRASFLEYITTHGQKVFPIVSEFFEPKAQLRI